MPTKQFSGYNEAFSPYRSCSIFSLHCAILLEFLSLLENDWILNTFGTMKMAGSGCGSVGRAVASDTKDPIQSSNSIIANKI